MKLIRLEERIFLDGAGGAATDGSNTISASIIGTEAQVNESLAAVIYSPAIDAGGTPYTTLTVSVIKVFWGS